MGLISETYSRPGYQQETYTVVQESYNYPQTGYPYSAPIGTGYNSVPFSHNQYQQQPMGDYYSRPHGHNHNHNQTYGYNYPHQNEHGLTTYSVASMGYGGNQCPPIAHVYGPSYATGPGRYGNVYSAFKEADD